MDRHNYSPSVPNEIDRAAFEPAYSQLVSILRRKISSGEYRAGDRLPSEAELCNQYHVSSITARRAIKILVEEDIAETRQGQGTFLKPLLLGNATFDLQGLQHIFGDPKTTVRILSASAVNADERVAQKLNLRERTRVIYIRRLLLQDGRPLMYHREYMILDPTDPTVEAELEVTSLSGLFTGSGQTLLKWGDLVIDATVLDKDEAALLQAAEGSPAFLIEHIFYDFEDTVTSWGWFVCASDRLRFRTSVGVTPA